MRDLEEMVFMTHVFIVIVAGNDQTSICLITGDTKSVEALGELVLAETRHGRVREIAKGCLKSEVGPLTKSNLTLFKGLFDGSDFSEAVLVQPVEARFSIVTSGTLL